MTDKHTHAEMQAKIEEQAKQLEDLATEIIKLTDADSQQVRLVQAFAAKVGWSVKFVPIFGQPGKSRLVIERLSGIIRPS